MTAENKEIDRLARAIGKAAAKLEPRWDFDWPHLLDADSNAWVDLQELARAVLQELDEGKADD